MKSGKQLAILGVGNIGTSIAKGLVISKSFKPSDIYLTRRNKKAIEKLREEGFHCSDNNEEAMKENDVIIITVTPQQVDALFDEIKPFIDPKRHKILSVVSGVPIKRIKENLGLDVPVVRVTPNTAIEIQESMTVAASYDEDSEVRDMACSIFEDLGKTIVIKEELIVPATALCACGTAFFLRAIRAASQGGIEIGFHSEEAIIMAAQTAKGAAGLLTREDSHPEREVDKVTTPQGATIAGLNQMEHSGFSSSMIKGIVVSFEKATKLYSGGN